MKVTKALAMGFGLLGWILGVVFARPDNLWQAGFLSCLGSLVGGLVYMVPTIVADARKQPAIYSILVVNLFLGWSVIGFVVALAWALNKKDIPQPVEAVSQKKSPRSVAEIACPRCAETIKKAAKVCRFCGHELHGSAKVASRSIDSIQAVIVEMERRGCSYEGLNAADDDLLAKLRPVLSEYGARIEHSDDKIALITAMGRGPWIYSDVDLASRLQFLAEGGKPSTVD